MAYTAATGEQFTDDDVRRWAQEAENGFPDSTVEWVQGRAWEGKRQPLTAKSVRAPQAVWKLVAEKAALEGITESEWVRNALIRAALA
ncbi:hypothetical protein J2S49_000442 [Arcanobacterium wilhelmae]|uniref:CopG family transcriptional regulator n=1 Tax=Arcanobacterium wilhelmae TaxID=1803177 RepID=A0ABT9N9I9_9ACTO|nr:hypothetical protein [Arcanobacterium wilhelmae]MDP9800366.1 hypothetical protein [Arcanobacterium wilhelmae]WFN89797.1 hypothetical protein P8A24_06215 [Arcanobacterium wilhelmae]